MNGAGGDGNDYNNVDDLRCVCVCVCWSHFFICSVGIVFEACVLMFVWEKYRGRQEHRVVGVGGE